MDVKKRGYNKQHEGKDTGKDTPGEPNQAHVVNRTDHNEYHHIMYE